MYCSPTGMGAGFGRVFLDKLPVIRYNTKARETREARGVYVPVAQLDRVSDSDSEGRRFEPCRAYQRIP